MPIITLTTDLGTKDHYVGSVKGAILSQCKDVTIIDISNQIQPFNILDAAFVLKNSYPGFPASTIHLVSVNAVQEGNAPFIAIGHKGHYFIGADNGIFSLALEAQPEKAFELAGFVEEEKHSFPLLSIAVNGAAHLANGGALEKIGKPIKEIQQGVALQPVITERSIKGTVIYIDNYENIIVNIAEELFDRVGENRNFSILMRGNDAISTIGDNYNSAPEGELVCFFNTAGYLEIAINSGNASSLLGLEKGATIQIDFV